MASALAIHAALPPYAVFGLAPRRPEDPIDSALRPLGFDLGVPDHTTSVAGWKRWRCCGREDQAPVRMRTRAAMPLPRTCRPMAAA